MQIILRVDKICKNLIDYKGKSYTILVLRINNAINMVEGNLRRPATGE